MRDDGFFWALILLLLLIVFSSSCSNTAAPNRVIHQRSDITCRNGYYVIAYDKPDSTWVCADSLPQ